VSIEVCDAVAFVSDSRPMDTESSVELSVGNAEVAEDIEVALFVDADVDVTASVVTEVEYDKYCVEVSVGDGAAAVTVDVVEDVDVVKTIGMYENKNVAAKCRNIIIRRYSCDEIYALLFS
jgi:hypothetical protein